MKFKRTQIFVQRNSRAYPDGSFVVLYNKEPNLYQMLAFPEDANSHPNTGFAVFDKNWEKLGTYSSATHPTVRLHTQIGILSRYRGFVDWEKVESGELAVL